MVAINTDLTEEEINRHLAEFGPGWNKILGQLVRDVLMHMPETTILYMRRIRGRLIVRCSCYDRVHQFIIDAALYRIAAISSKVCEHCGEYGRVKRDYLAEPLSLCWKCYALEASKQNPNLTTPHNRESAVQIDWTTPPPVPNIYVDNS